MPEPFGGAEHSTGQLKTQRTEESGAAKPQPDEMIAASRRHQIRARGGQNDRFHRKDGIQFTLPLRSSFIGVEIHLMNLQSGFPSHPLKHNWKYSFRKVRPRQSLGWSMHPVFLPPGFSRALQTLPSLRGSSHAKTSTRSRHHFRNAVFWLCRLSAR